MTTEFTKDDALEVWGAVWTAFKLVQPGDPTTPEKAAAAVIQQAFEARLAAVRAEKERDVLQAIEIIGKRNRTIAEQAAEIERKDWALAEADCGQGRLPDGRDPVDCLTRWRTLPHRPERRPQ